MRKKILGFITMFVMAFGVFALMPNNEVIVSASQADDIVSVAISQLGTAERSSGSDDVKYNDWYYGRRVYNTKPGQYAWCAAFVSWCANEAGISKDIFPRSAGTTAMKDGLIERGGTPHSWDSGYIPVHGDIIFFGNNASQHIGIVDYTSGNTVYYIDGNYTGTDPHSVHYSSRTFSRTDVWGTVTPKYTTPDPPTWASLKITNGHSFFNTGETINFNASSDKATSYWIGIDRDGTRVATKEMPGGNLSISFNESGNYSAYVSAINSAGYIDSSRWDFRVFQPVDLGNNRDVFIQNPSTGMYFTVDGLSNGTNNVYGAAKGDTVYQLWKLKKQSDGSYRIALAHDGRCIEAYSGGNTGGTNISVYKETEEFINQKFYFYNINGLYYIKPVYSDLVLDMASGDNHNVAIWGYGANWGPQMFKVIDVTYAPTWANLQTENNRVNYNVNETVKFQMSANNATEYHIGIDKNSKRLLTQKITTDNYSTSFKETGYYTAYVTARNSCGWIDSKYIGIRVLQPADLGTNKEVYIENVSSKQLLSTQKTFGSETINVFGSELNTNYNQKWKLVKQKDNTYKIVSVNDGRCLEVFNGSMENGANISAYTEKDYINQKFYIYSLFNAYYIKPVCSDKFVDMASGKPHNVATYEYADNWQPQMFNFVTDIEKVCTHNWSTWTTSKAATCTAKGQQTRKCSICGKTETQEISATGHKYATSVVAPTCTSKGYTVNKCSLCGHTYNSNETAAKGHSWSAWSVSKAATCTSDGQQTRKCSICGKEETQTISKTGHHYQETVIQPTYSEQGYTLHKCTGCGDNYKDNFTPKKRGYDPNKKPVASEVKRLQQLLTKAVKPSDNEDIVDMFDANDDGKVNVIDVLILKRRALK